MIYEHRTYNILPGKIPEFIEAFGKMIVPLFEKHGAKLIGAWQTHIGQNNEFFYILGFEDLNSQERFWRNFRQDEQFQEYLQSGPKVAYVISRILHPTSYSPIK
ncbi:NIPSNAP family protein [Chloroflexota bacterium]